LVYYKHSLYICTEMKNKAMTKEIINAETGLLVCVLCGIDLTTFGNNPQPVSEGKCCDTCNATKVLPCRILMYQDPEKAQILIDVIRKVQKNS
jgi:hypothetical protein